jgi:hypothetical protein
MSIFNDFCRVEQVLQHRRDQSAEVASKVTPYRVEFRYAHGTKHWQYFVDLANARDARDAQASYGPTGRASIEQPRSQQIQVQGPRGGWKRLK